MDKKTLENALTIVQEAVINEEPAQCLSVIVYRLREEIREASEHPAHPAIPEEVQASAIFAISVALGSIDWDNVNRPKVSKCDLRAARDWLAKCPQATDKATTCACGKPAACFGSYEGSEKWSLACSECCGHGNEDGKCLLLGSSDFWEQLAEMLNGREEHHEASDKAVCPKCGEECPKCSRGRVFEVLRAMTPDNGMGLPPPREGKVTP